MNDKSQVEASGTGNPDLAAIIERAKHELEQMIDLNPQIMLLLDAGGTILRSNKALLEMMGETSFFGVLGKNVSDIMDCGDPKFFSRLLDEGGISQGEALVNLPSRAAHMLRFSVVGSGRESELRVIIVEDITEEKTREGEVKQAHKKEAVRELMGALMHTINQHLTVISVRAKLMSMALEKGSTDQKEFKKSLDDITNLTMKIAETLSQVREPGELRTTHYLNGTNILDLNASAQTPPPAEDD
jgi:nitrogen-specific signal transduction histidine kinase